jgi:hypothetical protein
MQVRALPITGGIFAVHTPAETRAGRRSSIIEFVSNPSNDVAHQSDREAPLYPLVPVPAFGSTPMGYQNRFRG